MFSHTSDAYIIYCYSWRCYKVSKVSEVFKFYYAQTGHGQSECVWEGECGGRGMCKLFESLTKMFA